MHVTRLPPSRAGRVAHAREVIERHFATWREARPTRRGASRRSPDKVDGSRPAVSSPGGSRRTARAVSSASVHFAERLALVPAQRRRARRRAPPRLLTCNIVLRQRLERRRHADDAASSPSPPARLPANRPLRELRGGAGRHRCTPTRPSAEADQAGGRDHRQMHTDDCAAGRASNTRRASSTWARATLVDGNAPTATGTSVGVITTAKEPSLIRVRRDFIVEILKTAEDLLTSDLRVTDTRARRSTPRASRRSRRASRPSPGCPDRPRAPRTPPRTPSRRTGIELLVDVMHSDSRVQTCLQRALRGWVQPANTRATSKNRIARSVAMLRFAGEPSGTPPPADVHAVRVVLRAGDPVGLHGDHAAGVPRAAQASTPLRSVARSR